MDSVGNFGLWGPPRILQSALKIHGGTLQFIVGTAHPHFPISINVGHLVPFKVVFWLVGPPRHFGRWPSIRSRRLLYCSTAATGSSASKAFGNADCAAASSFCTGAFKSRATNDSIYNYHLLNY